MRIDTWGLGLLLALAAAPGEAAMVAKAVSYSAGDIEFEGHLVYDDSNTQARPGLLMVPNWYGAGALSVEKAKSIAGADYVVFVADMFGKGVRPTDSTGAGAAVKPLYADRTVMRERVNLALKQLQKSSVDGPFDGKRVAAIGFCFGGSAVLDLARSGAEVNATVTFHGNLSSDNPQLAKQIKGKVLVLNGADDKGVSAEQVSGFADEMRNAGVDWQFVNFGGAVHCFTETEAKAKEGNCKYDEKTAQRAYAMMRDLLDEVFQAK